MTDTPTVPTDGPAPSAPSAATAAPGSTDPSVDAPPSPESLLLAALREATGIDTLDFDADRDVGLRYASLPVLVRLVDRPPRVRIHAVVLDDAEPDLDLLERLNAMNREAGGIRWIASGRRVVAVAEIPAAPVVASHVEQALHGFCETVEGVARAMRVEFGEGAIRLARGAPVRVLH